MECFVWVSGDRTRAFLARWVSLGAGYIEEGTIYRAPTLAATRSLVNGVRCLVGNGEFGGTYGGGRICYARRMPWNPPDKGDRP